MIPPAPRPATPDMLFPAVVSPTAAQFLALLQQLETAQYLPVEEMRARQFRQISALAAHIDRAVPFYGLSLRKAGLKPGVPITEEAWARVPVLTRRQVQDAGEDLKATAVPPHHGKVFSMGTSGSTGAPLTVWKTELEQIYWNAFTLRDLLWQGFDLSGTYAAIRYDSGRDVARGDAPDRRQADWGPPAAQVFATGPAVLCDVRATIAEQAAWLRRENPSCLLSFPSVLRGLARHCLNEGITLPGLGALRASGEVLDRETRDLCRDAFGLEIAEIYSAVETGYLGLQCKEHGSLHVQDESALVEVLNEEGRHCAPGEVGRVVVTPLHNFAMPLVRYAVGDLAEVGPPCACGRSSLVLRRVLGRERDMLRLPDGARRFAEYGNRALHRIPGIIRHQVAQTGPADVEIRIVARGPLAPEDEQSVLDGARRGLGDGFRTRIVYRDDIPPGPGGKFQEFRCEVPD